MNVNPISPSKLNVSLTYPKGERSHYFGHENIDGLIFAENGKSSFSLSEQADGSLQLNKIRGITVNVNDSFKSNSPLSSLTIYPDKTYQARTNDYTLPRTTEPFPSKLSKLIEDTLNNRTTRAESSLLPRITKISDNNEQVIFDSCQFAKIGHKGVEAFLNKIRAQKLTLTHNKSNKSVKAYLTLHDKTEFPVKKNPDIDHITFSKNASLTLEIADNGKITATDITGIGLDAGVATPEVSLLSFSVTPDFSFSARMVDPVSTTFTKSGTLPRDIYNLITVAYKTAIETNSLANNELARR